MVKQRSKTAPLRYDDDSSAMTAAIDWCLAEGLRLVRPTRYQLKVGSLNFYADSGTLQHDREKALKARGLEAFKRIVLQQREVAAAFEDHEYPINLRL